MKNNPSIIEGGIFEDNRGRLDFFNDFDLSSVKRFYFTTNSEINKFRGWQGHKIEKRWFYCVKGSFRVELIKMDNWESPANDLRIETYELIDSEPKVLYVPNGYLNGFLSLEENSKMMILSDYVLGALKNDEFRFASNKWRKTE